MKMNKISNGQFFALTILTRMSEFLIMPIEKFSPEEAIAGAFLSVGIEAVLSVPLICFLSRGLKSDKISDVLTSLFFIISSSELIARFCGFMSKEYPHIAKPWIVALLLSLAAGYIAKSGIEGISRGAGIILTVSLITFAFIAILSLDKGNVLNFDPGIKTENVAGSSLYFLSISRTLALSFSLSRNLKYGSSKFVLLGILSSFIIQASVLLLSAFCLGKYIFTEGFLITAFSEYARADIIRHFSAVMMSVATVMTLITLGVYLNRASKERKDLLAATTCSALALSLLMIAGGYNLNPIFSSVFGIVILGVAMPAVDYIRRRKCENLR